MNLNSWHGRLLFEIAVGLFRLWTRTLRFAVEDKGNVLGTSEGPFILAIWHNRLGLLPRVLNLCFPHRHVAGLISASRDGDFIATLGARFGHGAVRGSSSRKGVVALRQLVDALAAGTIVLITPDGPRGPVYEVGQGIIYVAQKSGAAIVPMHMEYSSYWRLKSWDRFFVPRPFAKVRVIFGAPFRVEPTTTPQEFDRERLRVHTAMMKLVERK